MATTRQDILFPIGRLVGGSLYDPQTTDQQGQQMVYKTGKDAGKPRADYYLAVAIPKGVEATQPAPAGQPQWASTGWGRQLWAAAVAAFPQGQYMAPTFKWKVIDGDSQIPNSSGKRPCDAVGHPAHWVVRFSGSLAPKIVVADGSRPLIEPGAVKLGHYVQVFGNVDGNGQAQQPGMYINHQIVAHSGFGEEIRLGPDPIKVGFGGALPAGASAAPVGGMVVPAVPAAVMPVVPAVPAAVMPVVPAPSFLPVAQPPIPVAPPPAGPVPTAKLMATGYTVAQMLGAGWTEALLREQGYVA